MLAQHELPVAENGFASVSGFYPYQAEVMCCLSSLVSSAKAGEQRCQWSSPRANRCPPAPRPPANLRTRHLGHPYPTRDLSRAPARRVLVPMPLDRRGYRLGYGGGCSDRTLAELRKLRPVVAVGVAYAEQGVEEVPIASYDEAARLGS